MVVASEGGKINSHAELTTIIPSPFSRRNYDAIMMHHNTKNVS